MIYSQKELNQLIKTAQNPNSPKEILITLSQNTDPHVRNKVAENPSTPTNILIKLSQDTHWFVREGVMLNKLNNNLHD